MPSTRPEMIEEPVQEIVSESEVRILSTGIPRIDAWYGGFHASTITLIEGHHPFAFDILSLVCVRAVRNFKAAVVFVDGGNSIDLYTIASLSKRAGLKSDEVLSQILVARAFTAYQLDSIISERLDEVVARCEPSLVVIACITDLLMDRQVSEIEARTILRRCLANIRAITQNHNVISIITTRKRLTTPRASSLDTLLYDGVDKILSIEGKRRGIELQVPNRGLLMHYMPVSIYQTTLDEFMESGRC
ncbi:MAG: hypothetical protein EFT35_08950 [Methanophagales archaeon ANME-1-THS]|nr:MAG: hypothetical protein EFT35_08950 [Methanophagales archaeon ANME-1-THS]